MYSSRNENLRQYALITRKYLVSVSLARSFSQILLSLSDKTLNPSYVTPQDRVTFVIKLAALAARGGAEL